MDIAVAFGALGIAADLAINSQARAKLTGWLMLRWSALEDGDLLVSLRRTNELVAQGMRRVLVARRAPVGVVASIVIVTATLAAACLAITTCSLNLNARDTFSHGVRFYIAPALVAGACALGMLYLHVERAGSVRSAARLLAGTLALVLGSGVLWLAAMHAGLWHEWQFRRSPLEFASAWFYAEIYHQHRDAGTAAGVWSALALLVALPAGLYILTLLAVALLRLSAPVLAPTTITAARGCQRLPRGAVSLLIVVVLAFRLVL